MSGRKESIKRRRLFFDGALREDWDWIQKGIVRPQGFCVRDVRRIFFEEERDGGRRR